jgi:two-component system chemotaxis sensor kinase CheA
MSTDPDLLKLLVATFTTELEEQTQVMIDSLLQLEKTQPGEAAFKTHMDTIFRAAHNIKGAARGIGINSVGDLAHQLEDIFSVIRKQNLNLDAADINLVLDAVDKIRAAMTAYLTNTALPFDIEEFKNKLIVVASELPNSNNMIPQADNVPVKEASDPAVTKSAESIRVSIHNIDRVSALMEEIQVNRISIEDHYTKLNEVILKSKQLLDFFNRGYPDKDSFSKHYQLANDETAEIHYLLDQMHQNFRTNLNELSILSNSLHDEISRLRLIPAANLLQTLPRYVRTLSQEMHKQIELHLHGEDVKMDKLVLEGLYDPLLHLLRNAIDHGIETAAQRLVLGKSESANLTIEIIDEGNEILIVFKDDGAGIELDKIAATALKKNLITAAELAALNSDEILQLIFYPGFSTKDIITNISGRGVGLDVVKSNLAALKGSVKVETKLNEGTTFYLRVPLTLTSERGLMVRCSNQIFVLPTSSIIRVMNLKPQDMMLVEAEEVVMLDHHPIILRSLAKILNLTVADHHANDVLPLVIVKKDWHTLALIVNEIIGEREIVVKPLQDPLNDLSCISGGTLSSTGQVILVLNIADIITRGLSTSFGPVLTSTIETTTMNKSVVPHILVVDDSITTRTLEQNVLENKGYQVTVAVNGKEAWDLLQTKPFSMLITDVNMPIMDGFELTERVKQSEKLRMLPVIIVNSLVSDS